MTNKTYTLTVYLAAPGTPMNEDGQIKYSLPGHAYYAISDGTTKQGFGFAPIGDNVLKRMHGPGVVQQDEYTKYQSPHYERTMEITQAQYQALLEFGQRPQKVAGFNQYHYNFANNSCVDFTFSALKHAGIYKGRQTSFYDEFGNEYSWLDKHHEGLMKVLPNKRELGKIPDPVPSSPLNRTIERPLPPRNLLQKLLSENHQQELNPDRLQYAQSNHIFNLDSMPKPFQNLYPKIQEHLTVYHEKYGIPIDEDKKHNAALALSALAYSETMGKRHDVPLLFNIKDGQYLIGERNPGLIKTSMDMEEAVSMSAEHSLSRVQEITQQFEQRELERQMAQQQSRGFTMS